MLNRWASTILLDLSFWTPSGMQALELLYAWGRLNDRGELTKLGRCMAEFLLDPMLSKAINYFKQEMSCTDEVHMSFFSSRLFFMLTNFLFKVLTIISILSEKSYEFLPPFKNLSSSPPTSPDTSAFLTFLDHLDHIDLACAKEPPELKAPSTPPESSRSGQATPSPALALETPYGERAYTPPLQTPYKLRV